MSTLNIKDKEIFYEIYTNGFSFCVEGVYSEYREPNIPNKFLSYEENVKKLICDALGVTYKTKDLIEQSKDIEEAQLTIMEAMATQYEENLENQLIQLDVLATIYETQLEGAM